MGRRAQSPLEAGPPPGNSVVSMATCAAPCHSIHSEFIPVFRREGRRMPRGRELDSIDYNLVNCLASDARLSFAELGRKVGLSPSAVAERVRQLESDGIIRGYR